MIRKTNLRKKYFFAGKLKEIPCQMSRAQVDLEKKKINKTYKMLPGVYFIFQIDTFKYFHLMF